jgi:hypothetical protein
MVQYVILVARIPIEDIVPTKVRHSFIQTSNEGPCPIRSRIKLAEIRSGTMVGGREKGRNMPDPTEDRPGDTGGRFEEPAGEPDEAEVMDPEEAERHISAFITSADELSGPAVEKLAERVATLMRLASSELEGIMDGKPHNKVLATQLLLGQRARALPPDDPEQWRLYAASSLLSGMVIRGAER